MNSLLNLKRSVNRTNSEGLSNSERVNGLFKKMELEIEESPMLQGERIENRQNNIELAAPAEAKPFKPTEDKLFPIYDFLPFIRRRRNEHPRLRTKKLTVVQRKQMEESVNFRRFVHGLEKDFLDLSFSYTYLGWLSYDDVLRSITFTMDIFTFDREMVADREFKNRVSKIFRTTLEIYEESFSKLPEFLKTFNVGREIGNNFWRTFFDKALGNYNQYLYEKKNGFINIYLKVFFLNWCVFLNISFNFFSY